MFWTVKPVTLIFSAIVFCSFSGDILYGQEVELDQEVVEAINLIHSSGGRVMRIAANTDQYEASFHLASIPVKDEGLEHLKSIPNLIWLNLANTQITDDGLRHIADLPLKKLHLEKTNIGDDGLKHLEKLKNLEYLNIYATKVGDAGLDHLKGLTNLKKLYVWQSAVTETGIKELQTVLPELIIVGELSFKPVEKPADATEPAKSDEKAESDEKDKSNNEAKSDATKSDKATDNADTPQSSRRKQKDMK